MITSSSAQPQDVYTDLNSLQSINDIGRKDKGEALRKVAEQFESMFVKMMMKSMRDANKVFQEDSIMHSPQEDFYQQMYDDQLSVSLTGKQGMGLSDVIYRQLNQDYGDPDKRGDIKWQPLDDRRKHFAHAIDFNQIEKKNTQLDQKPKHRGFEINTEIVTSKKLVESVEAVKKASVKESASTTDASTTDTVLASEKVQAFESPEHFIQQLYPAAEKIAKEMGVSPKAIISQAALETGWGKFMITDTSSDTQPENSYNFFGIKADHRWDGDTVTVTTHEYRDGQRITEKADFRAYPSIEAGLKDYSEFLQSQRYDKALAAGTDVEQYAKELQQAGYATDPRYAEKITRIANSELMNTTLSNSSLVQNNVEVPRG